MKPRLILVIALTLLSAAASAMFTPIEQLDRFPQASVRAVAQDDIGYLWFGTNDGLVRFDGFEIHVFRNNPDRSLLPSNQVTALLADDDRLWIGTEQGLSVYRTSSDQWHSLTQFDGVPVRAIALHDNQPVIGTDVGVSRLTAAGDTTEYVALTHPVSALAISDDEVWAGTQGGGIWRLQPESVPLRLDLPDDASHVVSLLLDSKHSLWVGLDRPGGFLLRRADGSVERRPGPSALRSLDEDAIRAIFEDTTGGVWLSGYDTPGVFRYDLLSGSVRQQSRHADVRNVTGYFQDFSNTFWIATIRGPMYAGPAARKFGHFGAGDLPFAPAEPVVSATFEDRERRLWVATYPGALYRFHDDSHFWQAIEDTRTDTVVALGDGPDGMLWVGTAKELLLLDPTTLDVDDGFNGLALPRGFVADIRHTRDATWILVDGRLVVYSPACGLQDTRLEGKRMMGTAAGLWLSDAAGEHSTLAVDPQCNVARTSARDIPDAIVFPVTVDRRGSTWFEADQGLGEWTADGELRFYNEQNGLLNNAVYDVLEASDGTIWIPTNGGLSVIEPTNGAIRVLTPLDGIGQHEYNAESSLVRRDGRMVLGGMNGINLFDPTMLEMQTVSPRVVATNLRILDPSGKSFAAHPPADAPLELDSSRHGIEAGFAGITFDRPSQLRYRYRLDGLESQWTTAGATQRSARYTGLPAGSFTLEVMAAGANGEWSPAVPIVHFVVPTPWWRTLPALFTFTVLLAGCLALILYLRTATLRRQKRALEAEVAERTRDLARQKDVVEQQNEELKSLDRAKDAFFENISHEFRTPLTLILGPLKRIRSERNLAALDVPIRNAVRLLRLISQFLELSRLRAGRMTLQIRRRDFSEQLRSLAEAFAPSFSDRNLRFTLHVDESIQFGYDSQAMELILSNLLSNALKFTSTGEVCLSARMLDDAVEVQVKDTGCGIPDDQIARVFERFHTSANTRAQGSGVGLALVKELVELHGGTISVVSRDRRGSTFTARFPLHADADADLEIAATGDTEWSNPIPDDQRERRSDSRIQSLDQYARPELLIADDEPDMRRYLHQVFKDYKVHTASNGAEALEIAIATVPDAIVADVMMPEMDGFELATALRNHSLTCHIPIILLTARGGRDSRLEGLKRRVDDYVVKPFDEEELQVRVRNILELRDIIAQGIRHLTERSGLTGYSGDDARFIREMHAAIMQHATDPSFRIDELAEVLGLQKRTLQRKTQQALDKTPSEILRVERLLHAAELLRRGHTVTEATFGAGFNSVSHFSRLFREFFGASPSDYANGDSSENGR